MPLTALALRERARQRGEGCPGSAGDPAFVTYPWLTNPRPAIFTHPRLGETLARRLRILADALDLPAARIREWGIASAVLSAYWSADGPGEGWEGALLVAATLDALEP